MKLNWFATEGLATVANAFADELGRSGGANGLEIVAGGAIPNIELIPDNREQHGMRAEQQEPVFDGVKAELRWDIRGPAAVPARAVAIFGSGEVGRVHFACWGT